MRKKIQIAFLIALIAGFLTAAAIYLHGSNIAILNPKGPVALKERNLIYFALALSLLVVIPVYVLTVVFAWRYRESNTKAKYSPDLDHSRVAETIWWAVPSLIILVLAVVAWNSSHSLDPFKPLVSKTAPITIQVVALDWKWLFIYPQQKIASVNFFQIPNKTPINFEITSDAPMNSFWIPQLGGQIYAMPGMSTQLHLMASSEGSYYGSSANISGVGFAGMNFIAKSNSNSGFNNWVNSVRQSNQQLSLDQYNKLAEPSTYNRPSYYAQPQENLYDTIVEKYLAPNQPTTGAGITATPMMQGMSM